MSICGRARSLQDHSVGRDFGPETNNELFEKVGGNIPPDNAVSSRSRVLKVRSCQFVEQALGVNEILGVEALGEAVVDRCEQIVGPLLLTLLGPEPGQGH